VLKCVRTAVHCLLPILRIILNPKSGIFVRLVVGKRIDHLRSSSDIGRVRATHNDDVGHDGACIHFMKTPNASQIDVWTGMMVDRPETRLTSIEGLLGSRLIIFNRHNLSVLGSGAGAVYSRMLGRVTSELSVDGGDAGPTGSGARGPGPGTDRTETRMRRRPRPDFTGDVI
jgi:hypothetical protein